MTRRRLLACLLLGALLASAAPATATASIGAGIGATPIVLATAAKPGRSYRLPAVYILNTGTVTSTYQLSVERLSTGKQLIVPPAWVHFDANDTRLAPKKSATIPLTLALPSGAAAGAYMSDIIVGTVARARHTGGTAIGARAATLLTFHVADGGFVLPWPWPWWAYALIGAATALALAHAARRRYGLRIHLERRR